MSNFSYRILVIGVTNNRGGVESYLLNALKNSTPHLFTFYFPRMEPNFIFENEILNYNGKICDCISYNRHHYFSYRRVWNHFFKTHHIDAVYYNTCDIVSIDKLKFAKKAGVPVRIIHSHNTGNNRQLSFIHKIFEFWNKHAIKKVANLFFACSDEAGRWMFNSDNFLIIKNGIEASKFAYSVEIRERMRIKLGLQNKFVVGHIGRFAEQKNHIFLIEIFKNIVKQNSNAVLMLIGSGSLELAIRERAIAYGIEKKILFLGSRSDVSDLLQAMDVFVFPSIFEGFGISLIEAQAVGLKCFASDVVPKTTNITGTVEYLPLSDSQTWADAILSADYSVREDKSLCIREAGYDVSDSVAFLEETIVKAIEEKSSQH